MSEIKFDKPIIGSDGIVQTGWKSQPGIVAENGGAYAKVTRAMVGIGAELAHELALLVKDGHISSFDDSIEAVLKFAARCANEARLEEARWWRAQIDSRLHGAFYKTNDPTAARRIEDERIAELEAKK